MSLKLSLLGEQTSLVLVTQGLWCRWNSGLGVGCGQIWAYCAASREAPPLPPARERTGFGRRGEHPHPHVSPRGRPRGARAHLSWLRTQSGDAGCLPRAGWTAEGRFPGLLQMPPKFSLVPGTAALPGGVKKTGDTTALTLGLHTLPRRWSTAGCLPGTASGDGARTPAPLLAGRGHRAEPGSVGGGLPAPGATVPQTR